MNDKLDFFRKLKSRLARIEKDSLYQKLLEAVQEKYLLEDVCQGLDEGIVIMDSRGVPLFANRRAEHWLGITARVGDKKPVWTRVPDRALAALLSEEVPVVSTRTVRDIKIFSPKELQLRVVFLPSEQGGSQTVTLLLNDVTHRTEEEFEALMLSRMQSLVRLAGGIAHEIGNPLNAITIHLELLKKKLSGLPAGKSQELERCVNDIQDETRRLDRIIKNFLKATRKPPLRFQLHDINEVLADALGFMKPQLDQHAIRVKFTKDTGIPPFLMDRERLYYAFMNLIKNALEALEPGGSLKITVTCKQPCVIITFSDTGCGIAEEDLPKIFDIYYTTKKEGSGLGLMMVYDAISEHSGKIDVMSKPGKGTTFKVLLPIREPQLQLPHYMSSKGG